VGEREVAQLPSRRSAVARQRRHARQVAYMAIAMTILDRFVDLVADLPADVAEVTLFVTRETEIPYGVFAMSLIGVTNGMRAGRLP
jgi:hypothetical protein